MARLSCLLLLLASCAAAQSIEGTVVNSVSGIGIAGARVQARQGSFNNTADADSQGHFSFDGLKDGTWDITCMANGYAFELSARPRQVQVSAGHTARADFRMTPSPRLSGRVVDGNGNPAPNATVQLIAPASFYTGKADSDGKFNLHQMLPPGDYEFSATPPPGMKPPDPEPEGGRVLGWARTYYPGTTVREAAARVPLKPGSEFSDLVLKLMAVPAHTIRGVCLMPDGSPAAKVKIELGEGQPFPVAQTVETDADGIFEFKAVVDGEWSLAVRQEELRAAEWVEMREHDIDRLTLRLSPPFTVTGKVVMEVPQGVPAPRTPMVRLQPHVTRSMLDLGSGGSGLTSNNATEGNFTITPVYPGRYSVDAPVSVGPYYLDSVSLGTAEVMTPTVSLVAPLPITVVYKTNGGSVRGTVAGCVEGSVWLVPQEASRRVAMHRFAPCLAEGRYQLTAVRPGEYYALVAGPQFRREWLFGVFEEEDLNRADRVTVRAGETTALDLKIK